MGPGAAFGAPPNRAPPPTPRRPPPRPRKQARGWGGSVPQLTRAPPRSSRAATRLGVETALVLEDSVAGIASGRAAGFEVLTVRHPAEVAGLLRHRLC